LKEECPGKKNPPSDLQKEGMEPTRGDLSLLKL